MLCQLLIAFDIVQAFQLDICKSLSWMIDNCLSVSCPVIYISKSILWISMKLNYFLKSSTKIGCILIWTSHFSRFGTLFRWSIFDVYIFSSFLYYSSWDRTRAARSTGRRANHCATAESYEVVLKLEYFSKILIFKNGPSKQTKEVAWFFARNVPFWSILEWELFYLSYLQC